MAQQHLEQSALAPHSNLTCGQSRRGGVGTSESRRRSRFLGRVVVAHVQGSPKGGDALGLLRVPNTRLCSVPPIGREVYLSHERTLHALLPEVHGPLSLQQCPGGQV